MCMRYSPTCRSDEGRHRGRLSAALRQRPGQSTDGRTGIILGDMNVEDVKRGAVADRRGHRRLKLVLCSHIETATGSQIFRQAMIVPVGYLVEVPFHQNPFGEVSLVIDDDDNRIQPESASSTQFGPRHLEGP